MFSLIVLYREGYLLSIYLGIYLSISQLNNYLYPRCIPIEQIHRPYTRKFTYTVDTPVKKKKKKTSSLHPYPTDTP